MKTGCCHGTNKQKICSTEIRKTPAATTREKITPAATNPQTHMHQQKKASACCNDANRNAPATMIQRKHQPHALPTAPLNRPCYQAPYVACRPLGPISPAHPPGLAHASVYVLKPDDVDDDDGEGVLLTVFSTTNIAEYLCTYVGIKYREDLCTYSLDWPSHGSSTLPRRRC